jgi:hypothetical protein
MSWWHKRFRLRVRYQVRTALLKPSAAPVFFPLIGSVWSDEEVNAAGDWCLEPMTPHAKRQRYAKGARDECKERLAGLLVAIELGGVEAFREFIKENGNARYGTPATIHCTVTVQLPGQITTATTSFRGDDGEG